ncbi:hypothetical protein HDK90DRAFT_217743 [Phyllosticta capitalensis]|uniref:Secreted protein n=1 Tax=Phyllosticta capitalensis TaxID=121624 RepID=A0ABR1YT86_9PEZI
MIAHRFVLLYHTGCHCTPFTSLFLNSLRGTVQPVSTAFQLRLLLLCGIAWCYGGPCFTPLCFYESCGFSDKISFSLTLHARLEVVTPHPRRWWDVNGVRKGLI